MLGRVPTPGRIRSHGLELVRQQLLDRFEDVVLAVVVQLVLCIEP